jgi:hypothetical protein
MASIAAGRTVRILAPMRNSEVTGDDQSGRMNWPASGSPRSTGLLPLGHGGKARSFPLGRMTALDGAGGILVATIADGLRACYCDALRRCAICST